MNKKIDFMCKKPIQTKIQGKKRHFLNFIIHLIHSVILI